MNKILQLLKQFKMHSFWIFFTIISLWTMGIKFLNVIFITNFSSHNLVMEIL